MPLLVSVLFKLIYIYIYISSSLSSCRATSTDISDPLSPLFPIIHRLWQVFRATSRYPHIAAECMFMLVVLLLPGHMWESRLYIYIYIYIISCQHLKKVGMDYLHIEYMRNFIQIYESAPCMAIVIYFLSRFI